MNERRMKMAPGAAMLILILVVLTVSMLGVLTLMSARGDLTLSERSARLTEATCRLNAKAERTLAQIDALNAACGGDETALPEGVTLDAQGTPSYDLIAGVAYDSIPLPAAGLQAQLRAGQFDALYFGTLAQRAPGSSETLHALLDMAQVRTVFCDLNIRQQFYSAQSVRRCLAHATILKLSRDEAAVLTELGLLDFNPAGNAEDARRIGQALRRQFPQLEQQLLTLDADGAAVWDAASDALYVSDKPQVTVAATVGGGDSFGACYLRHYLAGLPAAQCLRRAVTLSNYVVTQLGAIPDYPPALRQALGLEA